MPIKVACKKKKKEETKGGREGGREENSLLGKDCPFLSHGHKKSHSYQSFEGTWSNAISETRLG